MGKKKKSRRKSNRILPANKSSDDGSSDIDDFALTVDRKPEVEERALLKKRKTSSGSASQGSETSQSSETSVSSSGVSSSSSRASSSTSSATDIITSKVMPIVRHKYFLVAVLLLISIFISIFMRSYSGHIPASEDWARSTVYNFHREQIFADKQAEYPSLGADKINQLVDQEWQAFYEANKDAIEQNVKLVQDNVKENFQIDQNGDAQTYLLAIDPYFYYRRMLNIIETGHSYDEAREDGLYDNHMQAPVGVQMRSDFHSQFSAFMYKFLHFFDRNLTPLQVFFMIPIIIGTLAVIPAFFIVRKKAGNFGGFVASIIVGMHPAFIGRTAGGFADTDAYNVLLPLLIAWLFLEAFEAKKPLYKAIFAGVSGILVGVFSYTWTGWWYIFFFIIAVLATYIIYQLIIYFYGRVKLSKVSKENLKNVARSSYVLGIFAALSVISVLIFSNAGVLISSLTSPFKFTAIKDAAISDLWPNVFTTVAELNPASLSSVIGNIGGSMLFVFALLALVFTLLPKNSLTNLTGKEGQKMYYSWAYFVGSIIYYLLIHRAGALVWFNNHLVLYLIALLLPIGVGMLVLLLREDVRKEVDIKYAMFLILWLAGTIYASTKGIRFVLLLVPAYGIAVGLFVGLVKEKVSILFKNEFKIPVIVTASVIVIGVLLFLGIFPKPSFGYTSSCPFMPEKNFATGQPSFMCSSHVQAKTEVPSMTDGWWDALTKIKENSREDAIINSWWDFGHWFKAIADRPVTFDGASQNTPMAHWIGRALLTDNEAEAMGILRMLDCGSYTGEEKLKEYTGGDSLTSIKRMKEIILLDKDDARAALKDYGYSDSEVSDVLELTHCSPPEDFFITSGDMVGKAGVWGHFGGWDFDKAFIYTTVKNNKMDKAVKIIQDKLGMTEQEARNAYVELTSLTNERDKNSWISSWPNYVNIVACSKGSDTDTGEEIFNCAFNMNIGSQNNNVVIFESATFYPNNVSKTYLTFMVVNPATGARSESTRGVPEKAGITAEDGIEVHTFVEEEDSGPVSKLNFAFLLDTVDSKALMIDPVFMESMFTKLFYLNGRYTTYFEKFDDRTTTNNLRIITWKVSWDGGIDNSPEIVEDDLVEQSEDGAGQEVDETSTSESADETEEELGEQTEDTEEGQNENEGGVEVSEGESALAPAKRKAVITTSKGVIEFELYENEAPITTANFIKLAEQGFYDGLSFHRVEPGFVIQGGDPKGDGTGGSPDKIPLEISPLLRHWDGAVSMARASDPNSASSQFFITLGAQHFLDDNYAVFGRVIAGKDVPSKIQVGDVMEKVEIVDI
ncbi:peptidylprolyl isomerase [Candidatus Woesearchaeota archaeon]|nr:peptidylprolyl isomerase [Candidatus Woesearchaeota archaeon]